MSTTVWIAIGIVFVIVWGAIIWGVYNAPLMPDDYGITEEDLNLDLDEKDKKIID
jgi:hypothetical protein|tara:strand:+ start:449 stop:613 length:165 start_codon:yes stop_codon:yes gene_type:complete